MTEITVAAVFYCGVLVGMLSLVAIVSVRKFLKARYKRKMRKIIRLAASNSHPESTVYTRRSLRALPSSSNLRS